MPRKQVCRGPVGLGWDSARLTLSNTLNGTLHCPSVAFPQVAWCPSAPSSLHAFRRRMRRPKRRLADTLAICTGVHRVRRLRISLGEPWRCWLLPFALGIPRYLPLFVCICTRCQGRSGLARVLLQAGVGYGQLVQLSFYARMGLGRSMMVSALFAPLRTHRARVCVLLRADISQVDSSDSGA